MIYHSDIKKDNFLVDANRCVWMIDFQHIGVLPLPFSQYAFYYTDNAFAAAVGKALNIEKDKHAAAMARASIILKQSGSGSLGQYDPTCIDTQGGGLTTDAGLNGFGEPVTRTSSGSGKWAPVSTIPNGGWNLTYRDGAARTEGQLVNEVRMRKNNHCSHFRSELLSTSASRHTKL